LTARPAGERLAVATRRLLPLALAVLALAATASPAAAFDLSVASVEVTQAIQTPANSIELVGNRSAAVRATISNTGSQSPGPAPVSARLHVFVNGSEITPADGLTAINAPIVPPASPDRANENHTLNFELKAPTGIGTSTDVDFRVDIDPQGRDTNPANNSGAANDLTSRLREFPRIFYVKIDYKPAGLGLPANEFIRPGTGDAFVCGILPIDDSQPDFYRKAALPSLTFSIDDGDKIIEEVATVNEAAEILSLLETQRQLLVADGIGANDLTYLYGWIAGNPTAVNGYAQLPGHVAWGNTQGVRGQRTFAHEFTHNLGLDHVNRTLDPEVGWDVGAQLDGNPAANSTSGRVKAQPFKDIQVPGQTTDEAWVDTEDYTYLLAHDSFSPIKFLPELKLIAKKNMFVLEGVLSSDGAKLRRLEPGFRYPWMSQGSALPAVQATHDVVVKNTAGKTFKAMVGAIGGGDVDGPHVKQGFFRAMLPVEGTVAEVKVVRRARAAPKALGKAQAIKARTLGIRKRSKRKPTLKFIKPPSMRLEGMAKVDWTASDPDTKTKSLRYNAAYSPDGGKSFVPIGVDLKSSKVIFDTSELRAAEEGKGLIRVFTSDGVNSSYKDLIDISVAAAPALAPTACQDP
jgi:hypothetical protein